MKTIAALLLASALISAAAPRQAIAFKVSAKLPDVAQSLSPADIHLEGWLGDRVLKNESARLMNVDLEPLLAGYRQKPGVHPWIGEHVGKWMHAATLAWACTGDEALRRKLDYAAAELIKAQEPDGYLGTYVPEKRFGLFNGADWDVWSHKYCLIGLLTYYQYTGDEAALNASRKAAGLLIHTFGKGKKSINSAGTHVGMAATSVLEPIVLLYRATGEEKYLEFARYIVSAWKEPNGAKIIDSLLKTKQVSKTANAKAYEMLSNLVGLCELARATGDHDFLTPVVNAWEDIVTNRLYITGSASSHEHFQADHHLPNQPNANVGETCVTTTWIQLNAQLLRLTANARYANELERSFYNHLAAAQRPDGAQWCYYTALEGTKPYGPGINCCVSSGPRGMALVPQQSYLVWNSAVLVSTFESSRVEATIGGQRVSLEQKSEFPTSGRSTITVHSKPGTKVGLGIRQPSWSAPLRLQLAGKPVSTVWHEGWLMIPPREWEEGQTVDVRFELRGAVVPGVHENSGRASLAWGPFVLAYDTKRNTVAEAPSLIALAGNAAPVLVSSDPLQFHAQVCSARNPAAHPAIFVPFADAGANGGRYQVWVRAPGSKLPDAALLSAAGVESRSRAGNISGSIVDDDPSTFVVTFDGTKKGQDWFAVNFDEPIEFSRIVYAHGHTFHDGGWFDATEGRPAIQVQREQNGKWENVAEISAYPAASAIDAKGLRDGQTFEVRLDQPVRARAVRVIGRPAYGDNAKQAFSSCGELQVFAK